MPRLLALSLVCLLPVSASAVELSPWLSLDEPRVVAAPAGWGELAWSPDGGRLSIHQPEQGGFQVLELGTAALSAVSLPAAAPAVFRHGWAADGAGLRLASRGGEDALVVSLRETPVVTARAQHQDAWAWAERDDIVVRIDGERRRVTQGEDRFYDPVLSPDGRQVVFSGLVSGLHVLDLDSGELWHLGAGRWPGWHPSGDWLVFERDSDDGVDLTGADLYVWHPRLAQPTPLLSTADVLERYPTISPDGAWLAYLQDGAVVLARLTEVAP